MSKGADSIDEVYDDPHAFGMPTLQEFAKNRTKWVGRDDEILESASAGGEDIKKKYRRHIYEIEGFKCRTLEEVERVASSQGIPLRSLDYRAILVPTGAGKEDVLVRFVSKDERNRRGNW